MTIEELWDKMSRGDRVPDDTFKVMDEEEFYNCCKAFTKYHVKKALTAVHNNMQLPKEDLEFTLSSYDLNNIT